MSGELKSIDDFNKISSQEQVPLFDLQTFKTMIKYGIRPEEELEISSIRSALTRFFEEMRCPSSNSQLRIREALGDYEDNLNQIIDK